MDTVAIPSEAAVTAIDAELADVMRKLGATPEDMIPSDAEHPREACETRKRLGAPSDLLEIVGSIGGTMDNRRTVDRLRRWNAEGLR